MPISSNCHLYLGILYSMKKCLKPKLIQNAPFPPTLLSNFWHFTLSWCVCDGKWWSFGWALIFETFHSVDHSVQLFKITWNIWKRNVFLIKHPLYSQKFPFKINSDLKWNEGWTKCPFINVIKFWSEKIQTGVLIYQNQLNFLKDPVVQYLYVGFYYWTES